MGGTMSKPDQAYDAANRGNIEEAKEVVSSEDFFERNKIKQIKQSALNGSINYVIRTQQFEEKSRGVQNIYYWITKTNIFEVLLRRSYIHSSEIKIIKSKGVDVEKILVKLENYYKETGFLGFFHNQKVAKLGFRLYVSHEIQVAISYIENDINQGSKNYKQFLTSSIMPEFITPKIRFHTFLMASHPKLGQDKTCIAHHAFFKNPKFDKNVIKTISEFLMDAKKTVSSEKISRRSSL
jgi:hypothetical protein